MLDTTSLPESHTTDTVPVFLSTVTPPGTVLHPESGRALVPMVARIGGPNVAPPSVDFDT